MSEPATKSWTVRDTRTSPRSSATTVHPGELRGGGVAPVAETYVSGRLAWSAISSSRCTTSVGCAKPAVPWSRRRTGEYPVQQQDRVAGTVHPVPGRQPVHLRVPHYDL